MCLKVSQVGGAEGGYSIPSGPRQNKLCWYGRTGLRTTPFPMSADSALQRAITSRTRYRSTKVD